MATRFVDAGGTEWEVWEKKVRPTLADARPMRPSREALRGTSSLCFESATQRRWLTEYPENWHAMEPASLHTLCQTARAERPPITVAPWFMPLPRVRGGAR